MLLDAPPPRRLAWRSPDAMLADWSGEPWLVMLDSGGPLSERSRWTTLYRRPSATFAASGPDAWAALRAFLPDRAATAPLPFAGGVVGLASYGAGLRQHGIASRHADVLPEITAARFDDALTFDRQEKALWWTSRSDAPPPPLPTCTRPRAPLTPAAFTAERDAAGWQADVRSVIAAIAAGDIFQANLTMRWRASRPHALSLVDTYRALRRTSPAPFGALFRTPAFSLLSASVERFIRMDAQGGIETRPIKGTARVATPDAENAAIAAALRANGKEFAENLMITDLMRNDIGRVSTLGSVTVPELCAVERFTHVHHLVSCVRGVLAPGYDAVDLLRETLPPGSVTGAPKHRAMQIIDTLEHSARGAYCGSLFHIGMDGALDSSVVIRSIAITEDTISIGAGGGITYPSDPAREYDEMCLKAAPLLGLFSGAGGR